MDFRFRHSGVTSSSLTSLSFVAIEGSVCGLDCLADLFPLNGHFKHSDELELLEDLDASFNEISITERCISVTLKRALTISRAWKCMGNRCQLVHLALTLKWLLIFDAVYGSWILSLLLFTLGNSTVA